MNYLNSLLNQHQIQEIHNNGQFDQEDFLEQLMSSVPSSFPWPDDQPPDISYQSVNPVNDDASVRSLFNGFTGSLGQASNQPQHLPQSQAQNYGPPATTAAPAVSQPAARGGQGRQRARRGQATDPHSIAERLRRERIAERMKGLQELVPNANKTDKASMLDEIIDYVKFLQLQVKVLSMSRLGGATPVIGDISSQGSNNENQVAKLLQEDMGSAMQYLQGKGLCLMPISLATAISTNNRGGPNSPNITLQSHKDSKP